VSYCAVIEFRGGKADKQHEFGNSWGGAARIWSALFDKYLKDPDLEYDNWLSRTSRGGGQDRSLWDLAKDARLTDFERAIHMATFDKAVVFRKDFARYVADLRAFDAAYPLVVRDVRPPGLTELEQTLSEEVEAGRKPRNHLLAWAELIEKLPEEVEAVGFHQTSVVESPWVTYVYPTREEGEETVYDYDADPEEVPYDLNAGDEHFDVYGELDAAKAEAEAVADFKPTGDPESVLNGRDHFMTIIGDNLTNSFHYKNHRGETGERKMKFISLWYGTTPYHPEPQWFIRGWDAERKAQRDYALADVVIPTLVAS
jgi:hypothetical protein